MFDRWGTVVHRFRYTVLGVVVVALLGMAGFGLSLNDHLSQSGWDDPGSASVIGAQLADDTFGRDTNSDVLVMYTAPPGTTITDPTFRSQVKASLDSLPVNHPDQIEKVNASFITSASLASADGTVGVASIAIQGDDDTARANNFRDVRDVFYIDGVDVQLAGLLPITGALNDTMAQDIKRMEILAFPAVGILLFFVFGGAVAAALPLIVGGLTVFGANGIVRLITEFTEVNNFVASVVSLIGFGLAIDYGLFMVSRFREELADGRSVPDAVRRTVATAGRTVVFSATIIIASLGGLILFPQGFLKSVAYGSIATVGLAAFTSITVLPAILGILGRRVDALSFKAIRQTKTSEEIENGFWGRLTRWVMKHPVKVTVPVVAALLLLTLPAGNIAFGGINEDYLPPNNVTREAQEHFDELFPGLRTEPLKLVVQNAQGPQIGTLMGEASNAPGLVETFTIENIDNNAGVAVLKAGLVDRNDYNATIQYLRSMPVPDGVNVYVAGTPAIEHDSIAALLDRLPLMLSLIVVVTTLLMFLTFGSLVLPIKAILATGLSLGATMGILTWIFVDGHGSELLNFTPGGIMAPVLVLIVAIIFGLSTDYEIFLVSRIVEARAHGASTAEAVRIGTAHTGRIITAAALILIVVTGAFAFSDLVMMKYISYGMIAALIIDATVIRMLFVPATMKLLGDDSWWAPAWMKRLQERIGLAEPISDADAIPANVPQLEPVGVIPLMEAGAEGGEPMTVPIPRIEPRGMPSRRARRRIEEPAPTATHRPAELDMVGADGGGPGSGPGRRATPQRGPLRPPPSQPPSQPRPNDDEPRYAPAHFAQTAPADPRAAGPDGPPEPRFDAAGSRPNGAPEANPAAGRPGAVNGVNGGVNGTDAAHGASPHGADDDAYAGPPTQQYPAGLIPPPYLDDDEYDDEYGNEPAVNGGAPGHPGSPARDGAPASASQQRPIESWLAELRSTSTEAAPEAPAPTHSPINGGAGRPPSSAPDYRAVPDRRKPSGSRAEDDNRFGGEYASSDPLFDGGAGRGGRHDREHPDDASGYSQVAPGAAYPGEDDYMTSETDSAGSRRIGSHRAPTGAIPVVPVPTDGSYGGRRHRRSAEEAAAGSDVEQTTSAPTSPARQDGRYRNEAPAAPRNGNGHRYGDAEPEQDSDDSNGRHAATTGAITVSELLARQRRD
ncbi:MMPL family transporter [Millisia brevis]|uniref:MMPL family transporter n=1 Tax=Millisia brevis TaxID=264148 RepID=UPI00082CDF57|nr:MMPL family transporter [Millisia brevis]